MSFKDLALPMIDLGVPVDIVQPLTKACYRRGYRGTLDKEQVLRWDAENPDYNVACFGSPDGAVILDCDTPGLVARIEREMGCKLPPTFTVKSGGKGCAHLYFRQTDLSRKLGNRRGADGQQKLFDLQSDGLYVVGPGSRLRRDDGSISTYDLFRKVVPFAEFPEMLGDWTQRYPDMRSRGSKEGDKTAVQIVLDKYLENLNPEEMFGIPNLVFSDVHNTLKSIGAYLIDGERDWDEIADYLERLGVEYGHRKPAHKDTTGVTDWFQKNNAKPMELEPRNLPTYSYGLKLFGTEEALQAHIKEALYTDYQQKIEIAKKDPVTQEKPAIRYPLEVWKGTAYGEYADLCTATNFTPPEFHIEALKTVCGAIAGHNMRISNEGAGRSPRFYTVLMAAPGIGKNTAIENFIAQLFHTHNDSGLVVTVDDSLIWPAQYDFQLSKHKRIGVCRTKTSSASGLSRFLPDMDGKSKVKRTPQERLLFLYPELTELFEKMGIEGSGGAMMSAFCDLYDGETFEVPALASQAPFGGSLLVSLLAGVQPQRWDQICGGRGIDGSGLDERFNLIPTEETRTKANLDDPDLSRFKEPFLDTLKSLEAVPHVVTADTSARKYMEEWFHGLQDMKPGEDPEDMVSRGRLNILAWRNALHYSWLTGASGITLDAAERGARLADYQLEVRMRYRPLTGDSPVAKAANAIMRYLRRFPAGQSIRLRDIRRAASAHRLGPTFSGALSHLSNMRMVSVIEEKSPTGSPSIIVKRSEEA